MCLLDSEISKFFSLSLATSIQTLGDALIQYICLGTDSYQSSNYRDMATSAQLCSPAFGKPSPLQLRDVFLSSKEASA